MGVDSLIQVDFGLLTFVYTGDEMVKLRGKGMMRYVPTVREHRRDGSKIGLSGEGEPGLVQRLLSHGRGHDPVDFARLQQARGFFQRLPRGAGRGGGGASGCVSGGGPYDAEVATPGPGGIGEAAFDQFRTDAGRVAGGESEDGARGHAQ